jgi:outer membrane protein assembly factor BamB
MLRAAIVVAMVTVGLLGGCGGGGASSSSSPVATATPPYVNGSLVSFASGGVPQGYLPAGYNSVATVQVLGAAGGSPVTDATVTLNGVALTYYTAIQSYQALLNVNANAGVTLGVVVGGTSYTATGTQAPSYPGIATPASGATWYSAADNVLTWSGIPAGGKQEVALGVMTSNGAVVWPAGNDFRVLQPSTTTQTIPANSLPAGPLLAWVGAASHLSMAGAQSGSGFYLNAFTSTAFTVSNTLPATLSTIAVTPASVTLALPGSHQLSATGTYSDSSTRDLTSQVTWQSLDASKATVTGAGLVSSVAAGSTAVSATLGGISGSASVYVFAPNPSPLPPLSQAVAYQIDYAHSGAAALTGPLSFPSSPAWSVTLNGPAGYPLIAGGMVFVMTGANPGQTYGTSLYALDEATGNIVWGPKSIAGTYFWAGHAYDHGTVFVVNFDGLLQSFDATTGAAGWSTQLPGQTAFSSPPTAVNGVVYTGGAGSGGTVYAVDESTGSVLWTASVANGDHSAPAVSSDGVFVSYPCQVYKFDPIMGTTLWHYGGPCDGGGGKTVAYANGAVFVRDPGSSPPDQIYDAATGTTTGTFTSGPIPALSGQTGYFQSSGTLKGLDLSTAAHTVLWTFTGDGAIVSAPIVVNGTVIIGSSSGKVYALDGSTGATIWSANAGAALSAPDEQNVAQPLAGMGAGEGYLVVPAGNVVTTWRISP